MSTKMWVCGVRIVVIRVTVFFSILFLFLYSGSVEASDQDHEPYTIVVQLEEENNTGIHVKAHLEGVTKKDRLEGRWTFQVDGGGKVLSLQDRGAQGRAVFTGKMADRLKGGEKVAVTATFRGSINEKRVDLSRTHTITPPWVDIWMSCTEDQVQIHGKLKRIKNASGRWQYEVRKAGDYKLFDRYTSDEMTGLVHSAVLKRPEGPFEVKVVVNGKKKKKKSGDVMGRKGGPHFKALGKVSVPENCHHGGKEPSFPAKSAPALNIQADHTVLIGRKLDQEWTETSGMEVRGVQIKAALDKGKNIRGIWRYHFAYPETKKLSGGKKKEVIRRGVLASHKGVVELPMRQADQYRVIVDFQGTVDGKNVHVKQPYVFHIPSISQKVNQQSKKSQPNITNIQMHVSGHKVRGHWLLAVARKDGEVLYLHEGKPHVSVPLPKGEYLLKTVFYGNVDGLPLAIQETKTLNVMKGKSETFTIPGKSNQYRRYDEGVRVAEGIRQSGKLVNSKKNYSSLTPVYSGGTAVFLIILGVTLYRKKKR
ncbi:hypothetical protein [Melghirimyces algeriensis]|nr:hypothetical protein [Melghirimyces algeriensis]